MPTLRRATILPGNIRTSLMGDISNRPMYVLAGWNTRRRKKGGVQQCYREAQREIVDQMSVKLGSQLYCSSSSRNKNISVISKSNSLSEFESEYQGLWDWLMDMESIATDSHELMMSEEQQHHLYKVRTASETDPL
ncbi:A-kinase anchor protein 6 isoform X1 [Tachysurus ichikawai]